MALDFGYWLHFEMHVWEVLTVVVELPGVGEQGKEAAYHSFAFPSFITRPTFSSTLQHSFISININ